MEKWFNYKLKNFIFDKRKFPIILLFLTGLILRLFSAKNLGFSADDINHAIRPIGIFGSDKLVIWDQSTALWYYIGGIFYKIFGNTMLASRLATVIFGSLTILLVYLVTKKMFNSERAALIAGFFIAFSPMLIKSTLPEMDIAVSFFTLFSLYFLLLYFDSKSSKHLALASIMISVATMVKLYALFFAFSFLIFIIYKELKSEKDTKKIINRTLVFGVVLIILVLPSLIHNFLLYKNEGFTDLIFTNILKLGAEKSKEFYSWSAGWMAYTDYGGFLFGNQKNFPPTPIPGALIVLGFLFRGDPLLFILGFLGLIFIFKINRDYFWFFIIIFVPAFIYLGAQIPMAKHLIWALVIIAPYSGKICEELILKLKSIDLKYILLIILIFNLIYLGMPKDVVHSHFYGESAYGKLVEYKENNIPEDSIVVVDNRIYSGAMHFGFSDRNYVDALTYATELDKKLPKDNLQIIDIYLIECVIDDCGWGTISSNPLLNATMEQVIEVFNGASTSKIDFEGPATNKFYLPFDLVGENRVEYRVYKTQLLINPAIRIAVKDTRQWYLYPIGYDRTISRIFDDYELIDVTDSMLHNIGFLILYFEMLISFLAIIYIAYILIDD